MPKQFISNQVLRDILEQATIEERLSLTKILDSASIKPFGATRLQIDICKEGGSFAGNLYRGQGTSYLDIVDDVLDELKISGFSGYNTSLCDFDKIEDLKFSESESRNKGIEYVEKAEEQIILKLLEKIYDELNTSEKEKFDKQLNKIAMEFKSNNIEKLSGITGLLILGKVGGFATYTFLTTALSTLSLGTLGFGAYTFATSLLSVALGPVGWAGLGIAGVFVLGRPEYNKLIPIVAIIGAIRQRLKFEKEISINKKEEILNIKENTKKDFKINIKYNKDNLLSIKEYNYYWINQLDYIKLPTKNDILNLCKDKKYDKKSIWFLNEVNQKSIFYKGVYESYEKDTAKKAYILNMK